MKELIIFLVFLMCVTLSACGTHKNETTDVVTEVTTEASSETNMNVANPWTDCGSLEDASKIAGFEMTVPESVDGYPNTFVQAMQDKMIQVFFCDKDVIGIKVQLKYDKGRGFLLIQRILEPNPGVELVYSTYIPKGHYRGPFFTITNNSPDTVYGRYLPGYFWGEIATIKDGVCGKFRPGTIDTNFADRDPLFPGKSSDAIVGSFGISLPPGTYRYKLIYQKDPTDFDSASLLYNDGLHEWFCSVKDGYQITYDFEIK